MGTVAVAEGELCHQSKSEMEPQRSFHVAVTTATSTSL